MKIPLKLLTKNPNHHTQIVSPLLALVVATLMAGTAVKANAELIVHSDANQIQQSETVKSVPYSVNNIDDAQSVSSLLPTDISIIKLMQVMHIDEQIQSIVNGQQAAIEAINSQAQSRSHQQVNDKQLNKRQRELQDQIQNVLGQYAKIMSNGIGDAADIQTLTQAYISAAKTYYTQAEVDAQIKFYDTAVGQNILAKQPQITAAFLKHSLPDDTTETEAQLGELLPQMKQIVKGIF
ncbi:DUF2059 domain-containing protein [Psychrobacter sp. DAB_AL62B]|uniref:DUF2059 domain-containing protein n=1 Tax=Psychrobacter sp. DAB_AL62B TaxID=1028420 RepID=UPI002381725D|nr:DUF2059 domain-containing protein [Psychrobacter sp. DAB_AL62B]MDE4456003.1 DUF2059 domain-containing protein [Psychrobacter sp. DAB_AL62B]